jgi:predicted outer membrane protein
MNRRNAILSVSGVAAASLLLNSRIAQAQQPAAGARIGENAYETQTLTVGTLSKQASQLALTNASHPNVKQFAQFEVNEQTTIAQVLTRSENPPPAALPPTMQSQLEQLRRASGKAFDAAYIQAQIQGHQQLLEIQQGFLSGNPHEMDRMHIAMLARTVIEMHLTMLGDLQHMVGAA